MTPVQLKLPVTTRLASLGSAKPETADLIETYGEEGDRLVRVVRRRDGTACRSSVRKVEDAEGGTFGAQFDWSWLRTTKMPRAVANGGEMRIADLFSGGGLMTLGAMEALRAVGVRGVPAMLLDMERTAAAACKRNFSGASIYDRKVEELVDGELGARETSAERRLLDAVRSVDLLLGGPPCQGHSDLNNHTRRTDGRNELALRMARFCELFQPQHVVLENVRGILHDTKGVLSRVEEHLRQMKYHVETVVAKAERLGVPQRRHRVFLVATKGANRDIEASLTQLELGERDFSWACGDLLETEGTGIDEAPVPSEANRKRIAYLFENGLHDLPDSQRPDCHKYGGHSYKSVYGRLWWNRPAQTITTGFRSVGQGRFVHPKRRRALTAHEAARLQTIPDFYDFGSELSTAVATIIGNAVPPKLAYAVTLALVR